MDSPPLVVVKEMMDDDSRLQSNAGLAQEEDEEAQMLQAWNAKEAQIAHRSSKHN